MGYTDLVLDLYGTLVDIHTEESDGVWDKTAVYFGFYGAHYTGRELKSAFERAMAEREARAGRSYECFPDIPFEQVMAQLFRQQAADAALRPGTAPRGTKHFEYEGNDWQELAELILAIGN